MVAAANACYCSECGVKCTSKFEGCVDVWAGEPPIPATFVERAQGEQFPAQSEAEVPADSVATVERTLADLQDQVRDLGATVQSAVAELQRVVADIELLEHDTRDVLNRHKNVLLGLGNRVKRLETSGPQRHPSQARLSEPQVGDAGPAPMATPEPPTTPRSD